MSLLKRVEEIRDDRTHGAAELAQMALDALKDAAQENSSTTSEEFTAELEELACQLAASRPSMAVIANSIQRYRVLLAHSASSAKGIKELKSCAVQAAARVIEEISRARAQSIANAAQLISDGSKVVTCSYSSTILEVLEQARQRGTSFLVTALESRSGGYCYGERTASHLKKMGLDSQVVSDDQAGKALAGADLALVGADAILPDGSLVNGYPTLKLAQLAAEQSPEVPFYTVCDSFKFHREKTIALEEGFELIPPGLIKGIVCEDGVLPPAGVAGYRERL